VDNERKYQRYAIGQDGNTVDQFEVILLGEPVHLVNFSVGGLYVLSKLPFSPGEISITVSFKNRGKIELMGNIIRVGKEGDMWGIAIDFSKAYDLNSLREV
jgi:hypothetical protein